MKVQGARKMQRPISQKIRLTLSGSRAALGGGEAHSGMAEVRLRTATVRFHL